jgi:uncharacterized protein
MSACIRARSSTWSRGEQGRFNSLVIVRLAARRFTTRRHNPRRDCWLRPKTSHVVATIGTFVLVRSFHRWVIFRTGPSESIESNSPGKPDQLQFELTESPPMPAHNLLSPSPAHPHLSNRLAWFCPPTRWTYDLHRSRLQIEPDAPTDFWQRTHYGFQADNGHFLFTEEPADFTLRVFVQFRPQHQYDQAGLMVRLSPDCWLKTSIEFEPGRPSRLGAVVTNHGYSDWSTQDFDPARDTVHFRVARTGDDYLI